MSKLNIFVLLGVVCNINQGMLGFIPGDLALLMRTKSCPYCDLRSADLSGEILLLANLESVKLDGAQLFLTDLREANLKGASLIEANLQGADLRASDLSSANLSRADLSEAKIVEKSLLYRVHCDSETRLPEALKCKDGFVIGEYVKPRPAWSVGDFAVAAPSAAADPTDEESLKG